MEVKTLGLHKEFSIKNKNILDRVKTAESQVQMKEINGRTWPKGAKQTVDKIWPEWKQTETNISK